MVRGDEMSEASKTRVWGRSGGDGERGELENASPLDEIFVEVHGLQ